MSTESDLSSEDEGLPGHHRSASNYSFNYQKHQNKIRKCKYCSKIFHRLGKLACHIRWEHPEEVQSVSPKVKPPKAHLKPQAKPVRPSHANLNDYQHGCINKKLRHECLFCGKMFKTHHELERHMVTHTKEKAFQCTKCKMSFSCQWNLTTHMKTHSGNDFRCEHCELAFTRKFRLTSHLKSDHGEEANSSQNTTKLPNPKKTQILQIQDVDLKTFQNSNIRQILPNKLKSPEIRNGSPGSFKYLSGPSMLRRHMVQHAKRACPDVNRSLTDPSETSNIVPIRRNHDVQDFEVNIKSNQKQVKVEVKLPFYKSKVQKLFPCPYCNKRWKSKSVMLKHLVVHTNARAFTCSICKLSFNWKQDLTRHLKIPHSIKCGRCDLVFSRERHLNEHALTVHRSDSTTHAENFRQSLDNLGETDPPMPCLQPYDDDDYLPIPLSRPVTVDTPIAAIYECEVCGKKYPSNSRLLQHSQKHIQRKRFPCRRCKQTFASKHILAQHTSDAHYVVKIFKCQKCDLSFSNETLFKQHSLTHQTQSHPEVASPAGSSVRLTHNPPVKANRRNTFPCPYCSKVFHFLSALRLHTAVHTHLRPYQCSRFEASFAAVYRLQSHMKLHEKPLKVQEKPHKEIFNCKNCGKHFFREDALTAHLLSHKVTQNLQITESDQEVPSSPEITFRARVHSFENEQQPKMHTISNKYECQLCGRILTSSRNLENHIKLHNGERAHKCKVCGCNKTYVTPSELTAHQNSVHSSKLLNKRARIVTSKCIGNQLRKSKSHGSDQATSSGLERGVVQYENISKNVSRNQRLLSVDSIESW